MTAAHALARSPLLGQISKHGILCMSGLGLRLQVQNGHLNAEWGIGEERYRVRLSRVNRHLRRVILIGSDGFATFDALRWITDIGASLVFLDRRGRLLFASGPTATSDARLRRAQALALSNGVGLEICRNLIGAKLEGQERMARERLSDPAAAQAIAAFRERLPEVDTAGALRNLEAQAAVAYFGASRNIPVLWPKADLPRIPDHWRTVGSRQSPLSGGPRLAVTPVHAILNYCFALLESESRLALAALGLDPGLGLGLHTDTPNRDSLALDVLEPVRPEVERWVFSWITREPLRRADFFETPTGNCRLMSHLCAKLSETAPTWSKLVAPWAEYVARTLWARKPQSKATRALPTHLTQQHRREAKGQTELPKASAPRPQRVCHGCGAVLSGEQGKHCALCGVAISRVNMIEFARKGRIASKSPESRARMSASQRRQRVARRGWVPSSLPAWLTQSSYRAMILPRLAGITVPTLAQTLNVSEPYAAKVRKGEHTPHPMHWRALAELVGVSGPV